MCKIEEVTGYRLGGRLHETRAIAIDFALGEIGLDIQKNNINSVKAGLVKHRDALIYLLGEHAQENPILATAEKDPPKLTQGELDAAGHTAGCRARATGQADECNCKVVAENAGLA